MDWNYITDISQLEAIDRESETQAAIIFKHSTRCSISSAALARMERKWKNENASLLKPYLLDLLNYRHISTAIAQRYNIEHESPQALIIKNGKCIYSQTHMSINCEEMLEQV